MLYKNVCYKMTNICLKEHCKFKRKKWQEINPSFNVTLQYGEYFAMLCVYLKCDSGCCSFYDYFFTISNYDHIYAKCMKPKFLNDKLQIYLPNGDLGLFDVYKHSDGFNDPYILKNVSDNNDIVPEDHSLNLLFKKLYERIKMRTMFKKLYFRCFRKSFAPNKRQAIENVNKWTMMINDL